MYGLDNDVASTNRVSEWCRFPPDSVKTVVALHAKVIFGL